MSVTLLPVGEHAAELHTHRQWSAAQSRGHEIKFQILFIVVRDNNATITHMPQKSDSMINLSETCSKSQIHTPLASLDPHLVYFIDAMSLFC